MAVVTGAASGIGRAVCRLLAGIRQPDAPNYFNHPIPGIVCMDIEEKALKEVLEEIIHDRGVSNQDAKALPRLIAAPGDVSDENCVKSAVKTCVREFGRIDTMIANAGFLGPMVDFFEEDTASFDRVFKVNVFGTFYCIKHAAVAMKVQEKRPGAMDRGSIVCVASVAGMAAGAGPVAYSASKAAVINMVGLIFPFDFS